MVRNRLAIGFLAASLVLVPSFFSKGDLEKRVSSDIAAQDIGNAPTKEHLDLPFNARGESGEEEDIPEIVTFYGEQLEGDAFVYVVDRSGSMQDSGELGIAKGEIVSNISEFSGNVDFGVVFFDQGVINYPSNGYPAEANAAGKSGGIRFVQSVSGGSGSCCQQGLVKGLQILNKSSKQRKVMVYLGDGGGTCHGADEQIYLRQTLSAVSSHNYLNAQVNAIGILSPSERGEAFMKELAARNGGTYKRITR